MAAGFELKFDAISYTLIALLLALLVLPAVFAAEPDIHPYALLRQSIPSSIRHPKETAIYRSNQTPHGLPLVSGLGLPSEQKYSTRNGDIRDIWKLAIEKGNGKLLSVKGVAAEEHDIRKLTNEIHAIGSHLKGIGAKRVAVHLPNDTENLVASFACAFYDLVLIILPFDPRGTPSVNDLLKRSSPDVVIAQGGHFPLTELEGVDLKEIILVVEGASQHLDWGAPPGSSLKSVQYDEIVKIAVEPVQDLDLDLNAPAVVVFGPEINGKIDIVEFSHKNIIAGVAAQTVSIPRGEKYTPNDVFVPVDTLSDLYARIHTYVALSSGSTVALSSIGGKHADVEKTSKAVKPTIIVASPESLLETHRATRGSMMEMWHGLIHYFQTRTLTVSGQIPQGNWLTRVNDYIRPEVGGRLRLVFVTESGGDPKSQSLNSLDLADLRIFFKAKVVYGLKHHKVAGPVTQYNAYDYRIQIPEQMPSRNAGIPRKCSHLGSVTPGVEIKLKDFGEYKADDEKPRGEVWVTGLPVAGGKETGLGFVGRWEEDCTLAFA